MNINSSTSSLNFVNRMMNLSKQQQANQMAKLSSGYRINNAADSPADLIISEQLRAQTSGAQRALRNTMETNNALSIAEGGLGSVASMLTKMKGLAIHSANGLTSGDQVNANQAELNGLLQSIQQVVGTTNYAGTNLLNGQNQIAPQVTNKDNLIDASSFKYNTVQGTSDGKVNIAFEGGASSQAEKGQLAVDLDAVDLSPTFSSSANPGSATVSRNQEFTVTGNSGSRTFSFEAGTSLDDIVAQINQSKGSTGVLAEAVKDSNGNTASLRLTSEDYGSRQYVQVQQHQGNLFAQQGATARDEGRDAQVTVNGQRVTADGLNVNFQSGGIQGSFRLNEAVAGQTGYDQTTPTNASAAAAGVSGASNGMQLQLGGGSGGQNRESLSLPNFNLSNLGKVTVGDKTYSMQDLFSGGSASLANDPVTAMQVIDQAIKDVSYGRAQIGAYQANTLQSNMNNLEVEIQNLTSTESGIRDTDMAQSITEMLMARLREQAGVKVYQSAKVNTQNTARLLLGQG